MADIWRFLGMDNWMHMYISMYVSTYYLFIWTWDNLWILCTRIKFTLFSEFGYEIYGLPLWSHQVCSFFPYLSKVGNLRPLPTFFSWMKNSLPLFFQRKKRFKVWTTLPHHCPHLSLCFIFVVPKLRKTERTDLGREGERERKVVINYKKIHYWH